MAGDGIENEREVMEVGKQLAEASEDVEELAILLEQAETTLLKVDQSPSPSMSLALHPLMKALIDEDLLKHQDMDVKVAVASCICEITRITAPDAPYSDNIMKEIFALIIEVLKELDDMSSHLYYKRVTILETIARIRACVIMLDLECDDLILEMFNHFLKNIRSEHSEKILAFVEAIMTLVIEESEDVSSELLRCLLESVKKDREGNTPTTRKLGQKIMRNCSRKLKPYLVEITQSSADLYSDYSDIIASIFQEQSDALEQTDLTFSDEHLETVKLEEGACHEEPGAANVTTAMNCGSLRLRKKESVALSVDLQSHGECTSGSYTSLSRSKKDRPPRSKLTTSTKARTLVQNQHMEEKISKRDSSIKEEDEEMKLKSSDGPNFVEELDENLIGSRIKVWWPDDKQFYTGYIDAFYPVTKKHKIIYQDGDVEVLLLKDERWKFIKKRRRKNVSGPDSATEEPQKKKAKENSDSVLKTRQEGSSRRSRPDTLDSGGHLSKGRSKSRPPITLSASNSDRSGLSEPGNSRLKEPDEVEPCSRLDNNEAGGNSRDAGLDVKDEKKISDGASNPSNKMDGEAIKASSSSNGKPKRARKSEEGHHEKAGNQRNRRKLPVRQPFRDSSSMVGFI